MLRDYSFLEIGVMIGVGCMVLYLLGLALQGVL